jgi:predicted amidohydrolase
MNSNGASSNRSRWGRHWENLKKGEEYCRKVKSSGADIVLFPEMWSIGSTEFYWPGKNHSAEL